MIMTDWRGAVGTMLRRPSRQARDWGGDHDFLPAALEVVEQPVSPVGRATSWVLLIGLVATLLWLIFGRVDVVATAEGRIIPTDDIKLVQAANQGIVKRIYVRDGDVVRKGQALVDLDPTVSTAEEEQAAKALMASELDEARNKAIAESLAGNPLRFSPPSGTPAEVAETQRQLISAQLEESHASVAGLAAARDSSLAEARAAAQQIKTYNETVPVLDKEVAAMHGLDAKGYAPGLKLLDLQRERRSEVGERDVAAEQQEKSLSDARKFGQQLSESLQEARQKTLTDLAKAQTDVILHREELEKAKEKSKLQRLIAPVDGSIQQLSIHTLGGVVEPAKTLMVIVPNGTVTIEAHVLNRDAGFVRTGQQVAVKLDAFPYTKYGTVPGRITSVSRDSVQDGKAGAYYVARIAVLRNYVHTENGTSALSSGLTAKNDIYIGSRRIIEYLLSPIEATSAEAAREK